jgi:hypothetical protein
MDGYFIHQPIGFSKAHHPVSNIHPLTSRIFIQLL